MLTLAQYSAKLFVNNKQRGNQMTNKARNNSMMMMDMCMAMPMRKGLRAVKSQILS